MGGFLGQLDQSGDPVGEAVNKFFGGGSLGFDY
jgi:hypothetical protein